jgi:tRNA threonylcarbamoyladenosine biosynthesis protein TsaE
MISGEAIYRSVALDELKSVAGEVAGSISKADVWLFEGDLGAGKTTLIKMIGELLGVGDVMSSPSFSIVNEYDAKDGGKVFHFDFYRIKNEIEAADIGVEDYFYSGHPCFVEWPEKIPSLIPAVHATVRIEFENESHRTIAISVHDGKEENRV